MGSYIVVTGGQFANKGAQAMTYITADEIAKRWPDCEMVFLGNVCDDLKKNLRMRALTVSIKKQVRLLIPGFFPFGYYWTPELRELNKVFSNCKAVIDISGYALGSNWNNTGVLAYIISRLMLPKKYDVPVYLMSQSFGPFDFKGRYSKLINILLKRYLPYPKVIMARERDGKKELEKKYKLNNVVYEKDIVLQNNGVDLNNVFIHPVLFKDFKDIKDHSVAVIPNLKNSYYGDKEWLNRIYERTIRRLRESGKTVYIICHSSEDKNICESMKKNLFKDDENVIFLEDELNCFEFELFVRKMDFVIASRFHAIVHSFRQRVPVIAIGWATKYKELLTIVGQDQFQFDVRETNEEIRIYFAGQPC